MITHTLLFTHDVTKCQKKIKSAADKNGLKTIHVKKVLMSMTLFNVSFILKDGEDTNVLNVHCMIFSFSN